MPMQIPHAVEGQMCPLHKKDVSQVCHTCPWWTRLIGKNPQSEEMIDNWHCAIAVLPLLLVENAQVSRSTTSALESMRNDVMASTTDAISLAIQMGNTRLLGRH
jgi:hypothetical protein